MASTPPKLSLRVSVRNPSLCSNGIATWELDPIVGTTMPRRAFRPESATKVLEIRVALVFDMLGKEKGGMNVACLAFVERDVDD